MHHVGVPETGDGGRSPVASKTFYRVRLTLNEGWSGEFRDLADQVWSAMPEIIVERAFRSPGGLWEVVVLTLDIGLDRREAQRVADQIERSALVASTEVQEETFAIWSDAGFLSTGAGRSRPALYALLVLTFFIHDPVSINFDENTDEYEPEVRTVWPRLGSARSARDVTRILHEEFVHWFSESAGPPEHYERLGAEVWRIWQAESST
jgi:hypothetical protein